MNNPPSHQSPFDRAYASPDLLLSAIVDSSDDAIVSKDLDGVITSWNRGAERIFGYSAEEMIGRSITTIIPAERADEEPQILARLRRGERIEHFETVRMRKGGERINVSVTISPIKDGAGKILGASKIARDITEQKRARRAVESAHEELARWERASADFLSTLSHELRSPLNTIMAWVQLLKESPASAPDLAEGLGVIEQSIRNQTGLIEDILDISRIQSGQVQLEMESLNVATTINAAVESVATNAQGKQVRLQVEPVSVEGSVRADRRRLQQVIRNLILNAIKFSPAESAVVISAREVNAHVEIAVRDCGPGIAPEVLPRIFERFHNLDPTTRRHDPGLGFGLYVARQLAKMHGGDVRAESAGRGQGAVLTVSLPLVNTPHAPVRAAGEEQAGVTLETGEKPSLSGIKVLVVDDEAEAANVLKRILESRDATALTAASMDEALETVSQFRPDVLVSDIAMPKHDGYELVRRLHCMSGVPFIPAVALTAFARSEDRTRALRAGFQLHIAKPVDAEELIAVVLNLATFRRE